MRWLFAALCVVSSVLAGSATVVAQCTPNPCAPGTCRVEGSGYVCSCPVGYRTDPTRCVLVDACAAGVDDCVVLARCEDAPGSSATYTCPCPAGYAGDGRESGSRCTNVNECASDPCGPDDDGGGATGNGCTEIPLRDWSAPGYTCSCAVGHTSDGITCRPSVDAGGVMDAGASTDASAHGGDDAGADDASSVTQDAADALDAFAADGDVSVVDGGGRGDDAGASPDASADGSRDSGSSVEAGTSRDASAMGLDAEIGPSRGDGGCACRASSRRSRFAPLTLAALLLAMVRRRSGTRVGFVTIAPSVRAVVPAARRRRRGEVRAECATRANADPP